MRPAVGTDIAQAYDVLPPQALYETSKPGLLNIANRNQNKFDACWCNWRKGIKVHCAFDTWIAS